MEKTKLLTITVIGLLLLNLGTLGFLFLNGTQEQRPPRKGTEGRPNPREVIIDRLGFDSHQQKEYDKIIDWHKSEIKRLDSDIREAKNELYALLKQSQVDEKIKNSLITVINVNQKQIEETHFKHFTDIKKICHPDQIDDYNDLTKHLGRIFSTKKPPRPRHD